MSSLVDLLQKKIQYVFNRISLNFIKEIKNKDASLKAKLKKNYMVFDKLTDQHVLFYLEQLDSLDSCSTFVKSQDDVDILAKEDILSLEILRGVHVSDILEVIKDEERHVVKCYLYMLYMLGYLYQTASSLIVDVEEQETNDEGSNSEEDTDQDIHHDGEQHRNKISELETMFSKSMKIINKSDDDDFEKEVDNIVNEDLQLLLRNIHTTRKIVATSPIQDCSKDLDCDDLETELKDDGYGAAMDFLHNSKIGELAKEISQDIDVSKLNVKNPEELLNIEGMFSGENNVLGDIIGKVSSKITSKIQNGEIKQDDLMNEAFSMMTKLNGTNSFMEDMMKSAMNQGGGMMGASPLHAGSEGRKKKKQAQLRRRLEERNRLKD